MFTLLLYALLALVAVACLYGLAVLFLSRTEQIAPAAADRAPWRLADESLEPHDIVDLRLPVALRGYRFAETDLLLDRLTEELRERDDEIARLKAGVPPLPMTARPAEEPRLTGPTGPTGPADPARPAERVELADPARPAERVEPADAD